MTKPPLWQASVSIGPYRYQTTDTEENIGPWLARLITHFAPHMKIHDISIVQVTA